jgi:hypothetical protein
MKAAEEPINSRRPPKAFTVILISLPCDPLFMVVSHSVLFYYREKD